MQTGIIESLKKWFINGGAINNTPIGQVTPAAGSFTTLSASSGLTVSAGGATVTGSTTVTGTVAATASADPFTGTTTATGTTEGSNRVALFQSQAAGRDSYISFGDSAGATARVGQLSSVMYFWVNGSTRMRIGTDGIVHVNKAAADDGTAAKLQVNGSVSLAGGSAMYWGGTNEFISGSSSSQFVSIRTNNSERFRANNSGILVTGLCDLSAASSGQIAFPAAQNPSSGANVLDDYEEGTFSPTIVGTSTAGAGTYTTQVGRYTKIGNRVYCYVALSWSAHTGTGNMRIGALPFASAAFSQMFPVAAYNLTITGQCVASVNAGATVGDMYSLNNGSLASLALDTAADLNCQFFYEV
jgi:hypothetical protein